MSGLWSDLSATSARRTRSRRRWAWLAASSAVLLALVFVLHLTRSKPPPTAAISAGSQLNPTRTSRSPAAGVAPEAGHPDWTFTTLTGQTVSLDSFRGRPVMLWFIAAGCASCAVSVPAVAQHIHQLAREGVNVLALDLYGDLDLPPKGIGELADFAQSTVGTEVASNWTWGLASKALSYAFDPTGSPDVYFFLTPAGSVAYRGSVPVSSMPELLAAAAKVAAGVNPGPSPAQPASPAPTVAQLP